MAHQRPSASTSPGRRPPYWFSIETIRPNGALRTPSNRNGDWRPPRGNEGSCRSPSPNGRCDLFHFNGDRTRWICDLATEVGPRDLEVYKCSSLYHDRSLFWNVEQNAITLPVTDGSESASSDDSPPSLSDERDDNWRDVKFLPWHVGDRSRVSYLCRRGPEHRLLTMRESQEWVDYVLPDRYHPARDGYTSETREGGMVGDLPLLLGLMAYTLPEGEVRTQLPALIGPHFKPPTEPPTRQPRGVGWRDKRGMIVTVYLDREAAGTRSDRRTLQSYEKGEYGLHFL